MTTTVTETPEKGLELDGIIKRYSGVTVLHGVSVTVRPGDILGLVGHNGAGKSTLLRIVSGATAPDGGTIRIDGELKDIGSPAEALASGVATVYQELSLLQNLTITQNVFLGSERTRAGILDREAMRKEARAVVDSFELEVDIDRPLGDYPVATRQMLEIAVAIHRNANYLLLDEPTTSLESGQVDRFLEKVKVLAQDHGLGIILVNHKLDELYRVCNRIVALVDGQIRIDARVDEIDRHAVVTAIAGEEAARTLDASASAPDAAEEAHAASLVNELLEAAFEGKSGGRRLEVRGLEGPGLENVTLTAEPGRVLGIYGLVGAGRTETLRSLVGLQPVHEGTILLDGAEFRPGNPAHAQREGLVYVTEERKHDGIVPALDSPANVTLPVLARFLRAGLLNKDRMKRDATNLLTLLKVRGNQNGPVMSLSGGNQQKVLLARAIAQRPRVLLLDEPTRGVDLGVKAEIHRIIRSLAHQGGLTVIIVSSEEDEVCELADDIIVMSQGHCSGELLPDDQKTPKALRMAAWAVA